MVLYLFLQTIENSWTSYNQHILLLCCFVLLILQSFTDVWLLLSSGKHSEHESVS